MKLSSMQVQQVVDQIDAEPVPDDHPAASQLEDVFGGHTFFLGPDGLHVVEKAANTDIGSEAASVVKLASWEDEEKTRLMPHGAQAVGVVELSGDAEEE
jgi:hypothetical protein